MPAPIDRDIVRHMAMLARIQLSPAEEERLERDLANILSYFKELQEVPTDTHPIDARGESLRNVFREDEESENTNRQKGTNAFPHKQKDLLEVPPVFE